MEHQVLDSDLTDIETGSGEKWAGFWIRVGASLIDFLVYLPLIGLNMYNLYVFKNLPLQLIVTLLLILYKPFMEFKYGATFGKMAVKIKVVSKDFEMITLSQSIIRYTPWIIEHVFSIYGTIMLFQHADFITTTSWTDVGLLQNEVTPKAFNIVSSTILLISCVSVGFSTTKQGLHDKIAGTYCIYKE